MSAAKGAVFGALFGIALAALLPWPLDEVMPPCVAIGAILALTRARRLAWPLAATLVVAVAVVAYTPLARLLLRQLERRDAPAHAPAVVVLGAFVQKDGTLSSDMQDRLVAGYSVLGRGEADTLVLTWPASPAQPWDPAAREQMRDWGLRFPLEVVGPVRNTHDEALAVAELARKRGWGRVILVTHAWHMRRAAAAFEKAGLNVICVPCVEGRYDFGTLDGADDRLQAFDIWLHEEVGYLVYKRKGWI